MMVHDRYCFQVGEGILLNVFTAENFKELHQLNILLVNNTCYSVSLLLFIFILKHDWTGVLIKIEVYICLNPFPDFTQ